MGRAAPRDTRKTAPLAQARATLRKRKSVASARTPVGIGANLAAARGGIIARGARTAAELPAKTAKGAGCY